MKSKLLGLMALVSLVLALSGGAASAVTFDWSTTGPTGSGTFTATDDGSGQYTITDITGTFDGGAITSLVSPLSDVTIDDLLFSPGTPLQLDDSGIKFLEGSDTVYIYNDVFLPPSGGYEFFCSMAGCSPSVGPLGTFTASVVTPLPAALPLFATVIGAMGLLGWRRKRKNAGVIAAA